MIKLTDVAAIDLEAAKASEVALQLEIRAQWYELAIEGQDSTPRLHAVQQAFEIDRSQ